MALRSEKLLFVMVGLPARGKSTVGNRLMAYLNWQDLNCELFNVGKLRRQESDSNQTAAFFDASNVEAANVREHLAMKVLDQAISWLLESGHVAIFDATNTTRARRRAIHRRCKNLLRDGRFQLIFLESICTDSKILHANFMQKVRNSPDYRHLPLPDAIRDLRQRIQNYEHVYEPVDETKESTSMSYIKLVNLQSKVICYNIHGARAQMIVSFLMSLHLGARPIWLVRAGHCSGTQGLGPVATSDHDASASATTAAPNSPQATAAFKALAARSPALTGMSRVQSAPGLSDTKGDSVATAYVDEQALISRSQALSLSPLGIDFARTLRRFVRERVVQWREEEKAAAAAADDADSTLTSHLQQMGLGSPVATPITRGWSDAPLEGGSASSPAEVPTLSENAVQVHGDATDTSAEEVAGSEAWDSTSQSSDDDASDSDSAECDGLVRRTTPGEDGIGGDVPSLAATASDADQLTHRASVSVPAVSVKPAQHHSHRWPIVYTSTLPRTMQTAACIPHSMQTSCLNPMDTGICGGIPLQYLQRYYPDEWKKWSEAKDKLLHRITGGESLQDVMHRLRPFVIELERHRQPVLLVGHLSTIQVLYSYFTGKPLRECISVEVPQHTIIELVPRNYCFEETRISLADKHVRDLGPTLVHL